MVILCGCIKYLRKSNKYFRVWFYQKPTVCGVHLSVVVSVAMVVFVQRPLIRSYPHYITRLRPTRLRQHKSEVDWIAKNNFLIKCQRWGPLNSFYKNAELCAQYNCCNRYTTQEIYLLLYFKVFQYVNFILFIYIPQCIVFVTFTTRSLQNLFLKTFF